MNSFEIYEQMISEWEKEIILHTLYISDTWNVLLQSLYTVLIRIRCCQHYIYNLNNSIEKYTVGRVYT